MPETTLEQRCGECRFFEGFGAKASDNSRAGRCLNSTSEVRFTRSNSTVEAALSEADLGFKIAGMRATGTSCFTPISQT